MGKGLFVGMTTLDLIYLTTRLPSKNEKIVASDYMVSAGGPATNAAVAFSYLGHQATLLSVIGSHPIRNLIVQDLESWGVAIADLDPHHLDPPPTSSILVTASTGERAVISLNATKSQVKADLLSPDVLQGVDVVLIDGHQMEIGGAIARQAKSLNIPVVVDGGSWKPNFEEVLLSADYAICSANFYPPNCHTEAEVFAYLLNLNIPHVAITRGERSVQYCSAGDRGHLLVPQVDAVDTTGAGDIFHGAFCHFILHTNFTDALAKATEIASGSCQVFGTRRWMQGSL